MTPSSSYYIHLPNYGRMLKHFTLFWSQVSTTQHKVLPMPPQSWISNGTHKMLERLLLTSYFLSKIVFHEQQSVFFHRLHDQRRSRYSWRCLDETHSKQWFRFFSSFLCGNNQSQNLLSNNLGYPHSSFSRSDGTREREKKCLLHDLSRTHLTW